MTIVEARAVTGGVDTHADMHVAAALDPIGGLLGVEESRSARPDTPACSAGWEGSGPSPWPASKGLVATARAWPGTSPRPASGSSRVDRSDRQDRRRQSKSDLLTELRGRGCSGQRTDREPGGYVR